MLPAANILFKGVLYFKNVKKFHFSTSILYIFFNIGPKSIDSTPSMNDGTGSRK